MKVYKLVFAFLFFASAGVAQKRLDDTCAADRATLSEEVLRACFDQSLSTDPRFEANLPVLAPHWQAFDAEQRQAVFERFRLGYTASEAIAAGASPRTAPVMRILHAQAIELAEEEFLQNISVDPELAGLSEDDFTAYRDELLYGFLDGTDNSSLAEFVRYAPAFTEYVLTFPADFAFSEDLARAVSIAESEANIAESEANIAESEANIAESEANIAEQNARQAALDRLIGNLERGID